MVTLEQNDSATLLDDAFSLSSQVKVHQDLCRQVLSLALQQSTQTSKHGDWIPIVQELRNSIYEWSELTPLDSFLRCDIISSKLMALRTAISEFHGAPSSHGYEKSVLSGADCLIPTLLSIFRSPDALDNLDSLPLAHCDTAISLFQRVLSALTPGPSPLRELVSSSLQHLQQRKKQADIGFDVPDLSLEIELTSSEVVRVGQMGDVVFGKRNNGEIVSMLVVKSLASHDVRRRKALRRDLNLRLSLQHPNLLSLYGTCTIQYGPTLVFPHLPHGNVVEYLQSHPTANAISFLVGAASALTYLHDSLPAIAHGDVRGANILVSPTGDAVLSNHGLVRLASGESERDSLLLDRDHRSSIRVLSSIINIEGLRWAAPEIVCSEEELDRNMGSPLDERVLAPWSGDSVLSTSNDALIEVVTTMSDVWSFGMTIYELLTNHVPYYQHARDETVMLAISLNERPLPPSSASAVRPEWQPEIWTLMQDCWRTDRRKRPTMGSVEKKLMSILGKSDMMRKSLALGMTRRPSVSTGNAEGTNVPDLPTIRSPSRTSTGRQPSLQLMGINSTLASASPPEVGSEASTPTARATEISSRSKTPSNAVGEADHTSANFGIHDGATSDEELQHQTDGHPYHTPLHRPLLKIRDPGSIPSISVDPSPITSPSSPATSIPESANFSLMSDLFFLHYRNSTPESVRTDELQKLSMEDVSESRNASIDILEGEDDATLNGHEHVSNASHHIQASLPDDSFMGISASESTTDLINEAFSRPPINLPATKSRHLPEDVRSLSSESLNTSHPPFPPGLEQSHKKPENHPSFDDFQSCQVSLELLLEEGTRFTSIAPESDVLRIIETADITILDLYDSMRSAHKVLLDSVQELSPLFDLGCVRKLFDVMEEAIKTLSLVYQDYADGLAALDALLANDSTESEFRHLFQIEENRGQLSAILGGPYIQLGRYFATLRDISVCLVPYAEFHRLVSPNARLKDWKVFLTRVRMWAWQSLSGTRPLIEFDHNDLAARVDDADEEWVARRDARLLVIMHQKDICNRMHEAQKRFEQIVSRQGIEPLLTEICDAQAVLFQLNVEVLDELYHLQRSHHPAMPPLTSIFLKVIERWEEAYNHHGRLSQALSQCGNNHGIQDSKGHLHSILRLPYIYIRGLYDNFQKLFDATPDHHFDIELIIRLLPSLSHLMDISCHGAWNDRMCKEMEELRAVISWSNMMPREKLWESPRRIIYKGTLYYPVDLSGDRRSIEDRGISVEMLVVLLDNCLTICEPRERLGVKRFYVRAILELKDLVLPDPDSSRISHQQIYLLDLADGKKVAVPIVIRYRESSSSVPTPTPRARASSSVACLTIREEDELHLLFPNELILLASSTVESVRWREYIAIAKSRFDEIPLPLQRNKNMFKFDTLAHIPFLPTSTATLNKKGTRALALCSGGNPGGVFIESDKSSTISLMQSMQVKQCFVIDSLNLALFLVGKALWSFKVDELTGSTIPVPVVIKNNVTFFRVGYQRDQLLLVTANETSKSTLLKWYTLAPPSNKRRSIALFTRAFKPFKSIGEYEIFCKVHDLDILEDGIVTMGSSGFQLLEIDQGSQVRMENLPLIPAGASSASAQRCQTSRAVGITCVGAERLLIYSDFGIYVNTRGEITGRAIDWTYPRILAAAFAAPYLFLVSESNVEVRLLENCRKLETLDAHGLRLVRGATEARLSSRARVGDGSESEAETIHSLVDGDPSLLHLAVREPEPASGYRLLGLQLEVLDLSA